MPAERPGRPVAEAVWSLEVRWIFPGQVGSAVAGWFGRFPAGTESREDIYLLDPQLRGLSVKIRGGGALEVKTYRGSPGILDVPGRARGRMESWQKWSFPVEPFRPGRADPASWRPVRKRRRISQFSSASGPAGPAARDWASSRGAGWNSPTSIRTARTGGLWDSRRPAPPACSAVNSRPPLRWCLRTRCPVRWNLARTTPGPTRSGWASGQAPAEAGSSRRRRLLAVPSWSFTACRRPHRIGLSVHSAAAAGRRPGPGCSRGQAGGSSRLSNARKWPLSTSPALPSSSASENGFSTRATPGSSPPWEASTGRA